MLFPLPFTAFESYMLEDDRPDSPMCFYLRLSFWGTLDERAFVAAVDQATQRHPLFRAKMQFVAGQPHWVECDKRPTISWDKAESEPSPSSTFIDLSQEVGLRVFVAHTEGQARVLLQFHHCCTDGVGAMQFVEDLLTIYTAEQGEEYVRPRLAPLVFSKLARRGRLGLGLWGRIVRLPLDALGLVGIGQFFGNRPAPLQTSRKTTPSGTAEHLPNFVSRRILESHLQVLRIVAKQQGVTVNDLLIRDLLLAIDAWNTRHNPAASSSCTRISVPVNLRQEQDTSLPATNVVSMVFVDRRIKKSTNAGRLLKSVRIDTWFVKRLRMGVIMIWILEALRYVRGGYSWLLKYRDCMATAVLSNLGVQFGDVSLAYLGDRLIVGDALLETVEFLPPIRRGTNAALGVITYAKELVVALQYNEQALDKVAADDVLRLFEDQLLLTAGIERVPAPSPTSRVIAAA